MSVSRPVYQSFGFTLCLCLFRPSVGRSVCIVYLSVIAGSSFLPSVHVSANVGVELIL